MPTSSDTAAAVSDEVGTDDSQTSCSLAEGLLSAPNAQNSRAANDPVCLATAAHLTKCMEEGINPLIITSRWRHKTMLS